ncbi:MULTISPECIES: ribulose-phosphate 3-epimerase [Pseudobutyrivibrio]|uniref:Ribulose-phosphate 3-epimerase n=1 Tax=Pseudobutyrivibrio xylanivorans TaxID=185007 RepID=A0A1G5RRW1_PSEXY|nr:MULTISPECIES: ribulose-phosphate 3-epimerase [Pseudobutyrivibrio]MDC7279810.1 ribulose-phosphate 3-epimerase [Butyrivibrio fibrisolvens]SCZ76726.1 ribulose-phosphate 3-epimerase [Pseudobutyrivibrio xylanivorans]
MEKCLAPSILSADFGILKEQLELIDEAGAQYVHFDVMDGVFVPSISFGLPVLRTIRKYTDRLFDVHLMIVDPERYIKDFVDAGADIITVHAEACKHLDATIDLIKKSGVMAGVAINPATPISQIMHVLEKVDMVLIMTVNPGFGGQSLIPYTIDKVRELSVMARQRKLKIDIEVDGGINEDTIEDVLEAGANIIVAGSAVFNGDVKANAEKLLEKMQ